MEVVRKKSQFLVTLIGLQKKIMNIFLLSEILNLSIHCQLCLQTAQHRGIGVRVVLRNWLQSTFPFIRHLLLPHWYQGSIKNRLIVFVTLPLHFSFSVLYMTLVSFFPPRKSIKLYLCALISVTVNNEWLEVNKLFGMKYELTFHNYHSIEDLHAVD